MTKHGILIHRDDLGNILHAIDHAAYQLEQYAQYGEDMRTIGRGFRASDDISTGMLLDHLAAVTRRLDVIKKAQARHHAH